jgi:hypothetical protein
MTLDSSKDKLSDSASSHRYITGEYCIINTKKYTSTSTTVTRHKSKKKVFKYSGIAVLAVIFLVVVITSIYKAYVKPTPFISKQLATMEILYNKIDLVLDDNYTRKTLEYDFESGNSASFPLNYKAKNSLDDVTAHSNYSNSDKKEITENLTIHFTELKVGQGIKMDDRIKSIILAYSPTIPYDKILAEELRLYSTVTEGNDVSTNTHYGNVSVNIDVNYKDEHRTVGLVLYRDLNDTK